MHAPSEPHLLTPLAHLGFYESVENAPYDPVISQTGIRELVAALPHGERDYLDALRAYSDTLYERLLTPSGARWLLDKTPAYALVLDFAVRLYPKAHYVVLTRHPLAIWSSYVDSFFDGDHEAAHRHNPLLERYVPAIARFLREGKAPTCHVRYEELVRAPANELEKICSFAGMPFEEGMVRYGEQEGGQRSDARGLGDPITVAQRTRPTTDSLARWAQAIQGEPGRIRQCEQILARLGDADLETWGYRRGDIAAELAAVDPQGPRLGAGKRTRYALERKLLVALRRNIHQNRFGRWVRRVRNLSDVLLR